jgi:hypothetical protein
MTTAQSFFRSINLEADIEAPDRLAHYQPTSRSLPVVDAVLGRDPTLVVAAYGSGKSLAAGIGALAVINDARSRHIIESILPKVRRIDSAFHQRLSRRLTAKRRGKAIILSGHVPDLPRAIGVQLGVPEKLATLERVLNWASSNLGEPSHLAIIWDEFGRHLESLVADGRSRELDHVQRLAEWAARAETPTVSLSLLSHQNLLAYAGGLNQTSRNEWRKIEGRFRTLRFVEDSRELYRLLVDRIRKRRGPLIPVLDSKVKAAVVQRAMEAGWFDGATIANEVADIVGGAWPLSAGALHALPRLAARVGQNERSLFSFLEEADLSRPIGFEELYRGFSDAMRSDVGAGGAHRRWIETESARAKAESEVECETLAAACLLQLGTDGERRKLSRSTLEAAVASRGISLSNAASAVDALIERKLLLHRRIVDDVSIWHGVDVDVAARLAEERTKRADAFDAVAFLSERRPAPIVRATRHNVEIGTARYLSGRYVLADRLEATSLSADAATLGPEGPWGDALYVLAESEQEITKARAVAMDWTRERTLFVIPRRPLLVVDAALEVACLEALRADDGLVAEDPLVPAEIDELLSVARRHLDLTVHRLTSGRPTDAVWIHSGRELPIGSECPATIVASELMGKWYPKTPRIANDQLMRQRVSKQMNTARVRLLMRITESARKPWMGYGLDDTSVEASVYRTVLANTGLHQKITDSVWGFVEPEKVGDPGLKMAWSILKAFFQDPSPEPKKLSVIVGVLSGPPIGAPAGVIPVIVMAGYQAFARCVSLRSHGVYVADVLGFDANRMFTEPERHDVQVHEADETTLLYLYELADVFAHAKPAEEVEALRFAYDAFARWRAALPDGARRSRRLSPAAQSLLRAAAEAIDPADLFLRTLPKLFGRDRLDLDAMVAAVSSARGEIDGLVEGYLDEAVRVLGEAFRIRNGNAVESLHSWVDCLDVDSLLVRDDLRLTDKAILRTARDTANGRYTPASLARAVSSILLQRGVEQWQDGTSGQYAMLLRECRTRIEDVALAADASSPRLAPVIRERIACLEEILVRVEGGKETRRAAGGNR